MNNKNKAAIAVEGLINEYSVHGGSSRILADNIVDTVNKIMRNRKPKAKIPKPWEAFSVSIPVKLN